LNHRTNTGRARAFTRLSFVQKFLPDYFRFIIDRKDLLCKFYEPQALLMCEEAVQVHGILIGLSIMDCNWCAKDEDLDNLSLTIELTPYLRILKNLDDGPSPEEKDEQSMIEKVLDQKNYVEELNKQLNSKLAILNDRIKELEESKEPHPFNLRETLSQMLGDSIAKLSLNSEPASSEELLNKLLEQDPTFLHELFGARDRLTRELQLKNEREMSMAAMEKDAQDKQDMIVSIRKQLEDVKTINIQLYTKLKECEHTLKGKIEQIALLEQKNSIMEATMLQYEAKSVASESKYCALAESHKRTCEQFVELGNAKSKLDQSLESEVRDRQKVQTDNRRLNETIKSLQQELKEIKESNFDFEKLRRDFLAVQKRCSDYELTMEELGIKLQSSKLEAEQLKETSISKDAIWTPDEKAVECFSCTKPFTVARRRHHCRYCGHIFCASCSDNKLPLPSSSKPCRVCDACHVILLERYSAK
jgi:RUN and FYVE domain-containing protein 1